jgi:hypothetical protein
MLALPMVLLPLPRWARGTLSVPCRPGTPAYRLESKTRKTYCHMPYSTGSCLPAREGFGAATCPAAPDAASMFGRAPTLPRVPQLRMLPPCSGGLRRCHMSRASRSCLPTREGFGAATCPVAQDAASLLVRALALPCVPQLWILPPYSVGLWHYHVSHGSRPRLSAREVSGTAICPAALCGPQTSRIKKGLVGLPMPLDSCVFKACSHGTETFDT